MQQMTLSQELAKLRHPRYGSRLLCLLVLPILLHHFILIQDNSFRTALNFFHAMLDGVLAFAFPILVSIAYASLYVDEIKNHYLSYVHTRTSLLGYHQRKLILAAAIGFGFSFLLIFLTFLYSVYIVAPFRLATFLFHRPSVVDPGMFRGLLPYGNVWYGAACALWVGFNGALYSLFSLLVLIVVRQRLLALLLPMICYFGTDILLQLFLDDYYAFSPYFNVFKITIRIEPLYVWLTPPAILMIILFGLYTAMKRKVTTDWEETDA